MITSRPSTLANRKATCEILSNRAKANVSFSKGNEGDGSSKPYKPDLIQAYLSDTLVPCHKFTVEKSSGGGDC